MDKPVDGAMCHAEVPVDDLERAKTFYAEAFGWTYQTMEPMNYTIFNSGQGGIGGGFAPRGEQPMPHPVNYMLCDDIDATVERINNAGGKITMPKMEVGEAGWMAHATDTEGNLIGLWQGKGGQ